MDKHSKLLWTEAFQVHASDTDFRSKGRLSFLLDIMQRAADLAVSNLGLSNDEMLKSGMGWMVITMDLNLQREPLQGSCFVYIPGAKAIKGRSGSGITGSMTARI